MKRLKRQKPSVHDCILNSSQENRDDAKIAIAFPRRNNYINHNYFNIPKDSLSISLDFVTLSNIHPNKEMLLHNLLLSNGFRVIADIKLQKGNYKMMRIYENVNCDTINIFHEQKSLAEGFNSLLMKIRHPNEEIMSLLDSIFKYHDITPRVSTIEMTFDFYVDGTIDLRDWLKCHLFLKNQRSKPDNPNSKSSVYYGDKDYTFYTNDLRKSSKGMRLYRKSFETKPKFVRLELVLHRSIIRRLGLQFPLSDIDSLDLSKFFYFACLKVNELRHYRIWQHREYLKQLKKIDPWEAEIAEDHIENWLRNYLDNPKSLMGQVEALRHDLKITNYHRFLEPINDLNGEFFSLVSSQKFIPSRRGKIEID